MTTVMHNYDQHGLFSSLNLHISKHTFYEWPRLAGPSHDPPQPHPSWVPSRV